MFRSLFFSALISSLAVTEGADLHVAPNGNDAWSGLLASPNAERSDGPLASLAGARNAIRRQRKSGAPTAAVHVLFADGTYWLTEPVVFTSEDSGTENGPIIYEAATDAHPQFVGGRRITGFKAGAGGVWAVQIPESGNRSAFEQLWVNGVRATRARTPNEGWFQAMGPAGGAVPGVALAGPLERTAIMARPEDLASVAKLPPTELRRVNALVYATWSTSRFPLAGIDASSGTLQFSGPSVFPFFHFGPHRFFLENFREALDAPGEWFLSSEGLLSYIPRDGEIAEKTEALAPVVESWITLQGVPAENRVVEWLQFRGLSFSCSGFSLPVTGWSDPQADVDLGAAIVADGTRQVRFENCTLSHTATFGFWFRRGCSGISVTHCEMRDLGAGGVKIGEKEPRSAAAEQTHDILVRNCIIQEGGRLFPEAVAIWIGQSGDNAIVHNDIGDFYYSAISMGWVWGFQPSFSVRNRVEANHLHHLGWGVLSDMGAVYTLGPSPGDVVRGNRVHDISCYSYGGWGLYTDEGSSDILLENNLVFRTESGGFHQHYGRENLVRNNIFAFGEEMQLRHSRTEDHLGFTFERNIVEGSTSRLFGHVDENWRGEQVKLRHNCYWQVGAQGPRWSFAGLTWEQWRATGQDEGSIIADPLFIDPEHGDFHLRSGSPAPGIGFVPFDFDAAGVEGDEAWKRLAAARVYPPMNLAAAKITLPPLQLHEGFENVPRGAHPAIARVETGGRADAIEIVDEAPSAGKQCLQVTDGPEFTPSWNPHFFYLPHHAHGVSRVAFDLKVEPAVTLIHEWRDDAVPYHTGPMFQVEHGVLTVGGKQLTGIPPNVWVRFEVDSPVGERRKETWKLRVTLPHAEPVEFAGLQPASAEMGSLEWLGFISAGTAPAKWWVDELAIGNGPK